MTASRPRTALAVLALALGAFLALVGPVSAKVVHEQQGTFPIDTGNLNFVAVDNSAGAGNGNLWIGELSFSTFGSRVFQTDASGIPTGVELNGSATPAGSFGYVNFDTFNLASAPAVDGSAGANAGKVYFPDVANGVVDRFNEDGSYDCQITGKATPSASECAGLTGSDTPTHGLEPLSVAVDPANGSVAVGNASGVVYKFNEAGEYLGEISDSHITAPFSLAFDSTGSLYVVNASLFGSGPGSAVKFDSAGSFEHQLHASRWSAAVDLGSDRVYVGGSSGPIEQFDAAGDPVSAFGENGALSIDVNQATEQLYLVAPSGGEIWSGDIFVPEVTTGAPSDVGETSATVAGQVDPEVSEGGPQIDSCEFEYVDEAGYDPAAPNPYAAGQTADCSPATPYSDVTDVSADLTGLSPSTTYHYRLVAENADGHVGRGEDATFNTFGPPVISGQVSRDAAAKSVTLRAQVNPFGYPTACEVSYVDDASFQATAYDDAVSVPCDPSTVGGAGSFGEERVEVKIGGLEVDTTYHFRFTASNQAGTVVGSDQTFATFGIEAFSVELLDEQGDPYTQAGGHPYEMTTKIEFNTTTTDTNLGPESSPAANIHDVYAELPVGLVGNPTAVARCERADLLFNECSAASQVGLVGLEGELWGSNKYELYNLVPPAGVVARLGFLPATGLPVFIDAQVRSGDDYGITAASLRTTKLTAVEGMEVTIWGVPADDRHDAWRRCANSELAVGQPPWPCPLQSPPRPFLATPTSCSGDLNARVRADAWGGIGEFDSAEASLPGMTGCDRVPFVPSVEVRPDSSAAGAPSGLLVDLDVPQPGWLNPDGLVSAHLKDTVVRLPEGVALNPSAADGLAACAPAQIAMDSGEPASCPAASRIGSVRVDTPVLDHPLEGGVFLAAQRDNPFGSNFAMYIAVHDPESGVVVKLPGHVEADPNTGRLTTTFEDNPQLPFEHFKLDFFGGPRAALAMPNRCGTYTTSAELTGWNGKTVTSDSTFDISGDGNGSPCAAPQFKPTLHAGLTNPVAGSSSSFVLRVQRDDIDNEFKTISTTMPPGLLAKVAGVPLCGDAQAAAGNCPAESQIGRVEVGAGAGSNPFYITNGKVYLTEGYKGGPFGLAISVPAVAGPFDLGTVNVRAALQIDPLTAQVTVVSDPMPRILQGIPLQVRDVRVIVDRDGFMQSPTNCNEMSVGATIGSYSDDSASVSNRFQVGECGNLAFAPKIAMRFTNRSQVHKRKKPGLDFRLSQKSGEANIKSVTVKLPRSVVLDVNGASGALCEVAQAENGSCPASSIVGHATAVTPLLDQPLSGAVYFVRGDNALPNIMVALRGQININLRSKSKVDKSGRLISTFGTVPDAPISQFHLSLGSAGHGVLSVAPDSDLCRGRNSKGKVSIAILGQNGKSESLALKIKTPCKKSRKHRR